MSIPKVKLTTSIYRKSTVYILDYTLQGKRYRKRIGKNKRDAELLQAHIQSELTLGNYGIVLNQRKSASLETLAEEFFTSKKNIIRNSTFSRYTDYITKFKWFFEEYFQLASNDIRNIKTIYIKECIDYLLEKEITNGKPWARKTVNGFIKLIRSIFQFAVKQEYCDKNPASDIKELPLPQNGLVEFFSDEDIERILNSIEQHWKDHIQFLLNTGLRKAEYINLEWKNVDLLPANPHITITSTPHWQTKTGKSRSIPLNKVAVDILNRHKGLHPQFVFTGTTNKKIHPDEPYHALKKALKTLGIEGDVHKLRHT